ncbi:hypothetical protein S245_052124, partial [Arachis hypogaea]
LPREQAKEGAEEGAEEEQPLPQEQHFPPQDYLQQLAASMEQMRVTNDSHWEQYMASVDEMRAIQNSRWEHLYTSLDEIRADQHSQRQEIQQLRMGIWFFLWMLNKNSFEICDCEGIRMRLSKLVNPTPQKSWNHKTYLLFPLHLDGTLLDNTKTMKAKKESFPTSDILQIFQQLKELSSVIPHKSTQQLCSGLKHMHGLGTPYAHNDVKPGNVLITHRKGQLPLAILMDFGSARPSRKHISSRSEVLQLQ